jgi:hypothetical protein
MKFCYIDESGTGDEPFAVMVGVVVDAYRMRPTKSHWDELLNELSGIVQREVKEFHTKDFYAGNSPWRGLKGPERAQVISAIFRWFADRNHHIVYSVIDLEKFKDISSQHEYYPDVGSLWRCLGFHLALSLQKKYQSQKGNKGNSVLVFDAHDKDHKDFAELLLNPPSWSDSYYQRGKKQAPLDQIVDVPHFVDSSHVGLIQVADCFSYFIRRHLEIASGKVPARYDDEAEVVADWANRALDCSISKASIYPKRDRCNAADFFYQLAPDLLL